MLGIAAAVPAIPSIVAAPSPAVAAPLFQEGDLLYRGVIIRQTNALSAFHKEIMREYVRKNLFTPYITPQRIIKL